LQHSWVLIIVRRHSFNCCCHSFHYFLPSLKSFGRLPWPPVPRHPYPFTYFSLPGSPPSFFQSYPHASNSIPYRFWFSLIRIRILPCIFLAHITSTINFDVQRLILSYCCIFRYSPPTIFHCQGQFLFFSAIECHWDNYACLSPSNPTPKLSSLIVQVLRGHMMIRLVVRPRPKKRQIEQTILSVSDATIRSRAGPIQLWVS